MQKNITVYRTVCNGDTTYMHISHNYNSKNKKVTLLLQHIAVISTCF